MTVKDDPYAFSRVRDNVVNDTIKHIEVGDLIYIDAGEPFDYRLCIFLGMWQGDRVHKKTSHKPSYDYELCVFLPVDDDMRNVVSNDFRPWWIAHAWRIMAIVAKMKNAKG